MRCASPASSQQMGMEGLGHMVFRVEGDLGDRRLRRPLAIEFPARWTSDAQDKNAATLLTSLNSSARVLLLSMGSEPKPRGSR